MVQFNRRPETLRPFHDTYSTFKSRLENPKRPIARLEIVTLLAIFTICFWLLSRITPSGNVAILTLSNTTSNSSELVEHTKLQFLKVSILESQGHHDEVYTALSTLFGSLVSHTAVSLYLRGPRWGSEKLIRESWVGDKDDLRIHNIDEWSPEKERSNILILTTCEADLAEQHASIASKLLSLPKFVHIICVIHNSASPMVKNVPILHQLISEDRITFLGLAEHTPTWLKNNLLDTDEILAQARSRWWAPIFEVPSLTSISQEPCLLSLQGMIDPSRRDLNGTIQEFSRLYEQHSVQLDKICRIQLNIIGMDPKVSGAPFIPDNIRERVTLFHDLAYAEYYALLARSMAVLPAFASNVYLTKKASSSIPAALIARTSIVASEGVMAAYSYLATEAHYVLPPKTSEIEGVINDIIDAGSAKILRSRLRMKRKALEQNIRDVAESNRQVALGILREVCTACFHVTNLGP